MPVNRPSIRVRTKQIVVQKHTTDPFVGFEHPTNPPEGWMYDSKRWCSTFDLRLPQLPRLSDGTPQGVSSSESFLSGVGDIEQGDLEVLEFNEWIENNERHWIPLIRSGHYYHYDVPFYYYSDDSRVQYPIPSENVNGRNVLLLDHEPNQRTPITAATYLRNLKTGSVGYQFKVDQRYTFSGVYTDGVESETVSDIGKINWDNVDYNKKEFIIDQTITEQTTLKFNRDFTVHYGVTPVVAQDLAACEILGLSNGSRFQVMYLRHFPIIPETFSLYVTQASSWTEWERADTWFALKTEAPSAGVNRYYLDKDLGIVYFAYAGVNSVPLLGETVVCEYDTTLRVEYEEEGDDLLLNAWGADISPLSQYVNQGFVCITHQQLEPAIITLSIDKQAIPFTNPREYGPVTAGSDFALLKATVTSSEGVPVPGIEVTFTMDPSNTGYLSGAKTGTGITDGKGNAFTSYQPPVSADELGFYTTNETSLDPKVRESTNLSYPSCVDVILPTKGNDLLGQESNVYIYQILKDDLLLGYDNVEAWIDEHLTPPPWVVIGEETETRWKAEVKEEYNLKDWFEVNTALGVKADGSIEGRKVVLYKTVAATYKTTEPKGVISNGTDNFDATAIDPSIDTTHYPLPTGAIVPIRPELIEIIEDISDPYYGYTRLIYPEDAVPIPEPANSSNNTAGYWLVSSKVINFQAYCWSSMYNRDIYSNKIAARISLPSYLLGEYVNEQLEKIPFGWKLLTDTDNVAAGLNGATFLTVNPSAGPYKIIDLVNSVDNEDWASAPFKSVAFQVDVE